MKFAMIELKMALVKLILNFEIKPNDNFSKIIEFNEGGMLASVRLPRNEISVTFQKRKK